MNNSKKVFWKYVFGGVFGMLGSAATILADAFFVSGRLGAEGLAAMNIAMCVFGLMNGTGLLFGVGGATRYTILRSQGRDAEANRTFTLSFLSALAAGLFYALMGMMFSRPISSVLGADEDILAMCDMYLKTILCFAPAFACNHLLMAFVRNDGDPGRSTRAMMTGSISNIVLDYLFMYRLDLGIFGAAFATGIAALIGISVSSLHWISPGNHLRFVWEKLCFKEIPKIASPGMATFVTELSSGVVLVVFNLRILDVSRNLGVAAYGIVANLALMILAVMSGICHGVQPIISHMYGKGDDEAAKQYYRKGTLLAVLFGCVVFAGALCFTPVLVRCFNGEGDALLQALAEKGVRLYFVGILFVGYNYLTAAYFSAMERSSKALFIALLHGFIGIIAVVCLLSFFFGMTGIWLAFPVTELLTLLWITFSERRDWIQTKNIFRIRTTSLWRKSFVGLKERFWF